MRYCPDRDLLEILACPDCKGSISTDGNAWTCTACIVTFPCFRGRPVLISPENQLFPRDSYVDEETIEQVNHHAYHGFRVVKRLIPGRSVNLSRERIYRRLQAEICTENSKVLVIGCGRQHGEIERLFADTSALFVFCDVDKSARADIFCDSHELPFQAGSFDLVIGTAVLEHVIDPSKVAAEIDRVLCMGGTIYSELPFLQSVHEGAYDFSRFTLSGHRALLSAFQEIETGMVAGPGTVLVWALDDFFSSLFNSRGVSRILSTMTRCVFFWLKYFDYWFEGRTRALGASSCTYYLGSKTGSKVSPQEIIAKFEGKEYHHI